MVGVTAFSAVGNLPISTVTGDPVARVAGHASLADTARAMVADNVGAMIVGDDDTPGALISERDIVRAVASGMDLNTVRAVDVASTKLVW
jgi:CBS domain-containing protein